MNQDRKAMLQRFQPKEVKTLKPDIQLCVVRFSPCGKVLAAGGFDGTVRLWDAASGEVKLPPLTGHNGWVQTLAFHPDRRRLFSADSWGRLRCWSYPEQSPKPQWDLPQAHAGWVRQVAVSPDGQLLATCGADNAVRLWSTDDGRTVRDLSINAEDVYSVAFHPDGKSLVFGDLKGVVRHLDLATGKTVRTIDAQQLYLLDRLQDVGGARRLAFDAGGTTLFCAGAQPKSGGFVQGVPAVLLFDWQSGKLKQTLKLGADNDGYVFDLHSHANGLLMVVTSGQPGVGKLLFLRVGDTLPFFVSTAMPNCHSLAVHPDGRRLAVAATNANSSGNGRQLGPNKDYPGNWSPVHLLELPSGA